MEFIAAPLIKCSTYLVAACLCKCYGGILSVQNALVSRFWHIVLYIMFIGASWLFLGWGNALASMIPGALGEYLCPEDTCGLLLCYRLSLAFTIFHLVLAVILFKASSKKDPRSALQNAAWECKMPFLIIIVGLCMFIPESFFLVYGWLMFAAAAIYILFQLVIVIDFSRSAVEITYKVPSIDPDEVVIIQSKILEVPIERPDTWKPVIISSTIVMCAMSLGLIWYMIFLFESVGQCTVNIVMISVLIFICFVITFVTLDGRVQAANGHMVGLFQVAVIALYGTFLTWNAVIVHDPVVCTGGWVIYADTLGSVEVVDKFTILLAFIYSVGSVFYLSLPESGQTSDCYNYSLVNFFYALNAPYLTMMMTNWSVLRRKEHTFEIETDLGWVPFILFSFSLLILAFLYLTALIAPLLCPSRFAEYRRMRETVERISVNSNV